MAPLKTDTATFTVQLGSVTFADSGSAPGQMTMRGVAAVYNRPSHDLGGFRTMIAPGAFNKILATNPDVHLVIDHDTRYVLARTKNKTLELRAEDDGLHVWARLADTTYARDLAVLMQRGDVDQMSFACTIGNDEWTMDDDENITRTLFDFDGLHDVTICAQGAFPQTESQLVASFARDADDILAAAVAAGRVPGRATMTADAAQDDPVDADPVESAAHDDRADAEDVATGRPELSALQARVRFQRLAALKARAEAAHEE